MKKSIKIFKLFFATSLSIGLFISANAQREGGGRTSSADRSSRSPRMEGRTEGANPGSIRESNRGNTTERQPVGPLRNDGNVSIERNNREISQQRIDRAPNTSRNNVGGNPEQRNDRNNLGGNTEQRNDRNPAVRNYNNSNNQQRTNRDNDYRNRNNYSSRNYNDQRYRTYRPYEPRHYIYAGAPRYSVMPRTSISIQFGGYPYYYNSGMFYNYYGGFYQPVFAPIGIRVRVLPFGYFPVYLGTNIFYYYNGTYYRPHDNNEYEVVDAPMGAQVSAMPKGTKAVSVNGEKFYEFNGTYYKEDRNNKGEVVYTVVGKNGTIDNTDNGNSPLPPTSFKEGDVVSQLPEGSRTVTINGQQLFVSPDDVYFKLQTNGNTISYKVVGATSNDKSPINYQEL